MGWLRRPSTLSIGFPGSLTSRVDFLLPDWCHCLQSLNAMLHSLSERHFLMEEKDGQQALISVYGVGLYVCYRT